MAGTDFTCPECGAKARTARDVAAGSLVRCPKCAHVFRLADAAAPAPESPASEPAAAAEPPGEVTEAGPAAGPADKRPPERPAAPDDRPRKRRPDDEDDRPRSRRRDDDDDDDDRRRSRRRDDDDYDDRRLSRRDDDYDRRRSRRRDDDDDDDDRSPRRKRKKSGFGLVTFFIVGGVFSLIFLAIGGGYLVYSWNHSKETPTTDSNAQAGIPPLLPPIGAPLDGRGNAGLTQPTDSGSDSSPFTANPTSIYNDPSFAPKSARRLIGPQPRTESKNPAKTEAAVSLSPDVLGKVKKATAFVFVTMTEKRKASGSGFFVDRDLVITNAHVVGMLAPGADPPASVKVVLNHGEGGNEVECVAQLLTVDSYNDLALLRILPPNEKARFPDPLQIAGSVNLVETQPVFISGFPLGEAIGRGVTVNRSEVSSFKKDSNGVLDRIQVNGGMEHGNSGGPVVDAAGNVVGVSVSGVEGTKINFAIPGERAGGLLDGQLMTITTGEPALEGGDYTLHVKVRAADPLKKIKSVALDWWWGDAIDRAPAGRDKPAGADRRTVSLSAAGEDYSGTIRLGSKTPDGKVLWIQAHHRDGADRDSYYQGVASELLTAAETTPVRITYKPRKNSKIALRSTHTLRVSLASGDLRTQHFNLQAQLKEDRLGQEPDGTWHYKVGFDPSKFGVELLLDERPPPRGLSIEEHTKHLGKSSLDLRVNREGHTTWAQPQFENVPQESQRPLGFFAGQVAESLNFAALTLPSGDIRPQQKWSDDLHIHLLQSADQPLVLPVHITYTYIGRRKFNGREVAEVSLSGEVIGGDDTQHKGGGVSGYLLVDVQTGMVVRANAVVESSLTVHHGMEEAKAVSILEVKLQRQ